MENGYRLTKSGKLLFRLFDGEDDFEVDEIDCNTKGDDLRRRHGTIQDRFGVQGGKGDASDLEEPADPRASLFGQNEMAKMKADASRHLLEDYIRVGFSSNMVHISRSAPDDLIKYVQSAIIAHNLGTTFDHALKHMIPDQDPDISSIHLSFQKMYFAGKDHMDETLRRMNPKCDPSAGEVFSDAALSRASNTYYVASLLYREGHMIEAHATSRLMLEQIAWAFSVYERKDAEAAKKISPTKAISDLKKKIKSVGKLYGMLSQYVHLPLKAHYEFVDLSGKESAARFQFGAHSYYFG